MRSFSPKVWFARQPVPNKIRLLIIATAAAALFVAIGLLSILEIVGYRQQLRNSIATLAQVTAVNATAATEFQDPSSAHTLVSSLTSEPAIDYARIYSAHGDLLANHDARMDATAANDSPVPLSLNALQLEHGAAFTDGPMLEEKATRTAFHRDHLDAISPIRLDGEVIGYVYVQANLAHMYETLALYAWTALVIMLAAMAIAYAVTMRMRKSLATPLVELAGIMEHVSVHQDYQARAGKAGNDEIGTLVDGFNGMLEQIQERDRRLEQHRRFLERQVAERTAHLERALGDARLASKAKSEFLARMSHEIRTPMNGVLGMTELLRSSALDARQRRLVETVYKSGESLLQIINDILDFSKAEAGRLQLAHIDFSLRDSVEEVCELLSERADAKSLELICAIAIDTPAYITGDPLRLKQILTNLIGNAIKFSEQGDIVVRVRRVSETQHLRFEVTDSGPGISTPDQQRLFEAFTQADAVTTRAQGGTGLGLAIARELVTLMHGEIGVHSEPNKGATFWFEIPYAGAPEPSFVRMPRMSLVGSRALVADDNAINREILIQYLEGWGMRVSTASNGQEALHALAAAAQKKNPYDVLILDHKMPRMDGLTCLRNIRDTASIKHTPVILLSSLDLALRNPELAALGIDESLTKPVRHARLQAAMMRTLGHDVSIQTMQVRSLSMSEVNAEPERLSNIRLLLAEDNDINREVALGMLSALGVETRVALDGAQAVDLYSREAFDAILMDCHMPLLDGFSATTAIRTLEMQRKATRVPIMALTANAMEGSRERCIAAGMDDYLVKPFTMTQLRTLIEKWAKKRLAKSPAPPASGRPGAGSELTLDPRAIDAIQALRAPDLLVRVIELYETRAPLLLRAGQAAVKNSDAQGLATAAHELKSSSANLGGERLARFCRECEAAARENNLRVAGQHWTEVCSEFERFREALQNLRTVGVP